MQKYQNSIVIARSSSPNGPVVPASGVTVTVYIFGTPTLATIYSDNGLTVKANPITADINGSFDFYAADGRYTLHVTGSDITTFDVTDILLEDPIDGSAAVFSTLVATGQVSLGGNTGSESFRVSQASAGAVNRVQVIGALTGAAPRIGVEGSDTNINYGIYSKGTGSIQFLTNGGALEQFRVSNTTSAVNFIGVTGSITAQAPSFTAQGTDTDIGINYTAKGAGIHTFNTRVIAPALTASAGDIQANTGNLVANTVGNGLRIREGANSKQDVATLVAGTVTINNTSITANSRVFAFCQTPGGTPGFLRCSARSAGVSYTILSSSGTDTSTIAVLITEPAP
jgi:hypothetical protein